MTIIVAMLERRVSRCYRQVQQSDVVTLSFPYCDHFFVYQDVFRNSMAWYMEVAAQTTESNLGSMER